MTDNIEYTESDRKYVEQTSNEVPLHTALDEACVDCGNRFTWVLSDPDLNGPRWMAECCDKRYGISVQTVQVEIMDGEL